MKNRISFIEPMDLCPSPPSPPVARVPFSWWVHGEA